MTYYEHFQRRGLEFLSIKPHDSRSPGFSGEPDAGNLHVRFFNSAAGLPAGAELPSHFGIFNGVGYARERAKFL